MQQHHITNGISVNSQNFSIFIQPKIYFKTVESNIKKLSHGHSTLVQF